MISSSEHKGFKHGVVLLPPVARASLDSLGRDCSYIVLIFFVFVLFRPVLASASTSHTGTESPVKSAQSRQDAVKTLAIKLRMIDWIAKGGITASRPQALRDMYDKMKLNPAKVIPAEEVTLESIHQFVIDGDKFRYENNQPIFDWKTGEVRARKFLCLFNGAIGKNFYPSGVNGAEDMRGYIVKDNTDQDIRNWVWNPLLLTFRGVHPIFSGTRLEDLKPSGNMLSIEGVLCQEYMLPQAAKNTRSTSYWMDQKRDCVIRRFQQHSKGQLVGQMDVSYRQEETCGWVPTSWVWNKYSEGGASLLFSTKIEVVEMRLNGPQSSERFEMLFPPETIILDQRNDKYYRIQPDGSMREVANVTGQELAHADTVPQPGNPWYRRHRWWLLGLGLALVISTLAYLWRRKQMKVA